jgi:hypothetical protein
MPEHSDVSTECSDKPDLEDVVPDPDGMWWAGHIDIDEEDDDVFYSMHRKQPQVQQNIATVCQQMTQVVTRKEDMQCTQKAPQDGASIYHESTYVNIDEEDDEVFFSVHKHVPEVQKDALIICSDEAGEERSEIQQDDGSIPEERAYVNIDEQDDDVFFSVHRHGPEMRGNALITCLDEAGDGAHTCMHLLEPQELQEQEDVESNYLLQSLSQSAALEAAVHSACVVEDSSGGKEEDPSLIVPPRCGDLVEDPSVYQRGDASADAHLRRVSHDRMEQHADKTCDGAPGLLGELRGGRAQSVRNYLARKLTEKVNEHEETC